MQNSRNDGMMNAHLDFVFLVIVYVWPFYFSPLGNYLFLVFWEFWKANHEEDKSNQKEQTEKQNKAKTTKKSKTKTKSCNDLQKKISSNLTTLV